MTTKDEIRAILEQVQYVSRPVVIYHCTSEYPCPFDRLFLLELNCLIEFAENNENIGIGFSNHGKGISVDIAAYLLGARWIERHFTFDRTAKYSDAAASLEPGGLGKLCRDLKNVYKALQFKVEMSGLELEQRRKLKSK